jgi:hypothetical protein
MRQRLGERANSRVIVLSVSAHDLERDTVVQGLKESIPEGLVADVLVAGRSWKEV